MENEYKLYRCTFIKEEKEYIIGKDRKGRKYYIVKNKASKRYKEGGDESFYATLEIKGLLVKKMILNPIVYDEYLKLINRDTVNIHI